LVASLAIERIDLIPIPADNLGWKRLIWLGLALVSMGPPVALLGTSLPWLFDAAREPRAWARLYAWNTLGCALGALGAAWLLLPVSGPVNLAIITGLLLGSFCLVLLKRPVAAGMLLIFLFILRDDHRLTGASPLLKVPHQVLAQEHGQDVTTAVIEARGGRALMIDGYAASGEYGAATKYMDAMGRLPMLLHEDPRDALVICFGTGQTAQALRDEQAERITAVDVNPAVFRFAKYFPTNRGVLNDPKLQAIVMDGRAWLRRTEQQYDVITLEPMPPMFAGTNALYSVEFYRLIASRLRPGGIAAQWFPMHLLSPENARAVAAAFRTVFPEAVLWIDPSNADARGTPQQGVLLGAAEPRDWNRWPGFARPLDHARPLEERTYRESIELRPEGLKVYARARPVTDDNLLLTHGSDRHLESAAAMSLARLTVEAIREAARADR
jgi:spermidine synthase